jgi:predicted RNA-binding Zn-ribbon protein involved in translation (DUF1610 family)
MSTNATHDNSDYGEPECRYCGQSLTPGYSLETSSGVIVDEYHCPNCGADGARRTGGAVGYNLLGQAFNPTRPRSGVDDV